MFDLKGKVAVITGASRGLGSGIVWARRLAVGRRQWISEEEFSDILSLCQFMPGRTSLAPPFAWEPSFGGCTERSQPLAASGSYH